VRLREHLERRSENFFRTGSDDGPKLGTALHRLHLRGEPSAAGNPLFQLLRVVGQHVGGVPIVRHPDARGVRLVEIGRVKPEPCAGGDANAVERDDPQDQGTGGVALAVDDHPFAAVAYGGVFELVLMNEAAVVLADAIIRERGASRCGHYASRAHDRQEKLGRMQPRPPRPIGRAIMPPSSGITLTRPAAPLQTFQIEATRQKAFKGRAANRERLTTDVRTCIEGQGSQ
jgi:hypothetical protein